MRSTARTALGATSNVFTNVFTQAPDGTVFYLRGAVIYAVAGPKAQPLAQFTLPRSGSAAMRSSSRIVALAVNASDIFVQFGLTITEYSRSTDKKVRHWTLTSPVTPITSAGLIVVGHTLWSWTDWATDQSGFEYAKISRISTSGSSIHVTDRSAFPGEMAADSSGLYFETEHGSNGYLGHARPTGSAVLLKRAVPVEASLALVPGRLDLLSFGTHDTVSSYRTTTLGLVSSKRVSGNDRSIAGTGLGLLVLADPCAAVTCSSSTVSLLSTATGSASGTLRVPNAVLLFSGPAAAVLEVSHGTYGQMHLVWIGP